MTPHWLYIRKANLTPERGHLVTQPLPGARGSTPGSGRKTVQPALPVTPLHREGDLGFLCPPDSLGGRAAKRSVPRRPARRRLIPLAAFDSRVSAGWGSSLSSPTDVGRHAVLAIVGRENR